MKALISASILSADFAHLAQDCKAALDAGADMIHFDVMDHHYVPNLSFGALVCKALRRAHIQAPIDVHLMVDDPDAYITPFAQANANLISFHPQTSKNYLKTMETIRANGMRVGLAFNPDEAVTISDDCLKQLDMILIMTVFPGFEGQTFIPECLGKIADLSKRIKALRSSCLLSVDGGIKIDTIAQAAEAGANCFVVGSGLFNTPDYAQTIAALKGALVRSPN